MESLGAGSRMHKKGIFFDLNRGCFLRPDANRAKLKGRGLLEVRQAPHFWGPKGQPRIT
jgi:hypothetical protein